MPQRRHFAKGWMAGSRSSTGTISPSRSEVAERGGLQGHGSCILRTEKRKGLKPSPGSPHTRTQRAGQGPSGSPCRHPRGAGGWGAPAPAPAPALCSQGADRQSWGRTWPWFGSTCSGASGGRQPDSASEGSWGCWRSGRGGGRWRGARGEAEGTVRAAGGAWRGEKWALEGGVRGISSQPRSGLPRGSWWRRRSRSEVRA